MPENKKPSVRIRMYRQGLGDCFLLTFFQENRPEFNMMIDCGLLQGTRNGGEIMRKVVENIGRTIENEREISGEKLKWLDVVVVTHEHADHISGFKQADEEFKKIHFGEVWAGWMDDINHPKYKAVRERFHKQVSGLKAAHDKMNAVTQEDLKKTVGELLDDFFEPDVLGAADGSSKRPSAWELAIGKSVKSPRFCTPGTAFILDELDDIRFYVLGPPENYETFTQVNPPAEETYRDETKVSNFALAESFFAAAADNDLFDTELSQPFEKQLRISADRISENCFQEFFEQNYGLTDSSANGWRKIDDDWLNVAGGLALNLDSYTNNTCLALAIEFVKSGKVLLFPGDAQFANWISWQKLNWEISDNVGGKKLIDVRDLLKRTVFYKVGHHGSHNATLKTHGLKMMTGDDLSAMIPVDTDKAKSKTSSTNPNGWEMPETNLFAELIVKTRGRVILADDGDGRKLAEKCSDTTFIPKVKYSEESIRQLKPDSKTAEPIFVELTIEG